MTESVRITNADEAPERLQTIGQQNTQNIERAMEWVFKQSEDGKTCPLCGWQPAYDSRNKDAKLQDHLRGKHTYTCIEVFLRGTIDPTPEIGPGVDIIAEAGLEVVDSFDAPTTLYIPDGLRKRYLKDGGRLRWAAPYNLQRYKDMGFQMVRALPEELEGLNLDNSKEDNVVRSNEMTLMFIPQRVGEKRDRVRERAKDQDLYTRKEQLEQRIEGHARSVYDLAVRKGATKQQARNLARATERGLTLGTVEIRRGNS